MGFQGCMLRVCRHRRDCSYKRKHPLEAKSVLFYLTEIFQLNILKLGNSIVILYCCSKILNIQNYNLVTSFFFYITIFLVIKGQHPDSSLASLSLFAPQEIITITLPGGTLKETKHLSSIFIEKLLWAVRRFPHFLCVCLSLLLPKRIFFTLEGCKQLKVPSLCRFRIQSQRGRNRRIISLGWSSKMFFMHLFIFKCTSFLWELGIFVQGHLNH